MKERKPTGNKIYDGAPVWFWAVMYKPSGRSKPYITTLYPRWKEAKSNAHDANRQWEQLGWRKAFSTKRFRFYFKGLEIDAYEHMWERSEAIK